MLDRFFLVPDNVQMAERGRPKVGEPFKVRFPPDLIEQMDEARGEQTRSEWLQNAAGQWFQVSQGTAGAGGTVLTQSQPFPGQPLPVAKDAEVVTMTKTFTEKDLPKPMRAESFCDCDVRLGPGVYHRACDRRKKP